MTNREYIIAVLQGEDFDDNGAVEESVIHHNISCPYMYGDSRAHCIKKKSLIRRELCVDCKTEWLDKEVDE